jgi:hypothetical protein
LEMWSGQWREKQKVFQISLISSCTYPIPELTTVLSFSLPLQSVACVS